MEDNFKAFLEAYEGNLDSPEWLSKAIVILSTALYTHNTQMAQAELDEMRILVAYLDDPVKKYSVSEAGRRAQVETFNKYAELKAQGEAVLEMINSVKKRLEVLGAEAKL